MNKTTNGKTSSSSLAITEKKAHRPGGCIGIFFQIFDWNRKMAKKKLFSKKLLPPARAKQASKKFKGDEKMPNSKLHLIANENVGGFPSAKKGGNAGLDVEQKHEMRIPSLVARLMGLESIPASQRDKSKKASFPNTCGDGEKDLSFDNHCESDRVGSNSEMGMPKHETRPQKLQKTGVYERRAVTRFGAEALQIKGVLSQARKHHQPKLPSPLKSPRITTGKNVSRNSRLIGAATKILEPGLQATSRAKCSIAYSGSMYHPKNDNVSEGSGAKSVDPRNQSSYDAGLTKPLIGKVSFNNCGNLLDVVGCGGNVEGQPVVPPHIVTDMINDSSSVSAQRKARSLVASHEQESDVVVLINRERLISPFSEEKGKSETQAGEKLITRIIPLPSEVPASWNSSCQPFKTLDDDLSSVSFMPKTQTKQEHMLSGERILPGSNERNIQMRRVSSAANSLNGTKDFVALNRNLSGRTRPRSPTKLDNSKLDVERKPCNRHDDSLSHGRLVERKRRTPIATQVDPSSVHSNIMRQRSFCSNSLGGKRRDNNASTRNSTNVKSKRCYQGITDNINDNKVNDVFSFAFNSPLKHRIDIHTEKEETGGDNEINTCFLDPLPLKGDVLGAFLEQKLKELTSQDEELSTGFPPKKSTAMILQELISALSAEHLTRHDGHLINTDLGSPDGLMKDRLLGTCDGNHPSPGSVLEASFSSSSLDESSGHGLHPNSLCYPFNQPEMAEYDGELLDSATSYNKGKLCIEAVTDLVSQMAPRLLQRIVDSLGPRMTKSRLSHVKDVILNAELLLGNATTMHIDQQVVPLPPHVSIVCFLVDELGKIADLEGFMGCEDFKERKQLKEFLFDSVIECVESMCCRYCNCGFEAWKKLPLWMKTEKLIVEEVKREIKKWSSLVGMMPDEIIEWEMSQSLGKWTDFDIEAFEEGVAIDGDILGFLVDEIVEDLVDC